VIIFPAHGAGSACGGSISNREDSTIGVEEKQNKMLQMDREEFMSVKRREKIEKPFYFLTMEKMNLIGQPILGRLPQPPPLDPEEFASLSGSHAILDIRNPPAFAAAHIKNSLSVPLEVLASYAGWVLRYDLPLLLVLNGNSDCQGVVRELIRIGFDRIDGYLRDGMEGWTKSGMPISSFPVIDSRELNAHLLDGRASVLDVRMQKEWDSGRIEGAQHIFVGHLYKRLDEVPRDRLVAVICSSGLRGSLGASILQNEGFDNAVNVLGGMSGWKKASLPVKN
jgi:hydroxyacylglutathione hydrolase